MLSIKRPLFRKKSLLWIWMILSWIHAYAEVGTYQKTHHEERAQKELELWSAEQLLDHVASLKGIYPDSAVMLGKLCLNKIVQNENHLQLKPKAALAIAQGYAELRQLDSAQHYYQLVLEWSGPQTHFQSKALNGMGIIAQYENNDLKALQLYQESLEIDKLLVDSMAITKAYLNISTILHRFGRSADAITYAKLAYELSEARYDVNSSLHALVALANQYHARQQYDSAIHHGNHAMQIATTIQFDVAKLMAASVLSPSYILSGSYEKGLRYADTIFKYAVQLQLDELTANARKNRAYAQVGLGQYTKARYELGQIPTQYRDLYYHDAMAQTLIGLGKRTEAIYHQRRFRQLTDSTKYADLTSQVSALHIGYETAEKDKHIDFLSQQAEIQSLLIAQRNSQLLIGGLVALLLIVGGFLLYQRDRNKKAKAASELQQRFLRSQLNSHFIFNSMTAIQNYLITHNNAEQASYYMGMFSSLMRQILENSRQEFISLKEEVNMLKNYLELQKIRFSSTLAYTIDVDDAIDLNHQGIPPMFAQPFIENAIEHGLFKAEDRENEISIRFSLMKDGLIGLEIADTGVGNAQTQAVSHQSLATQITRERLSHLEATIKKELSIRAENKTNDKGAVLGYVVHLILPMRYLTS